MYDGIDFKLEVRDVRLQLTHTELGYIFKLLLDCKYTTVRSSGCLLIDVLSLFLSERDVPQKDSNTKKLDHARYRF
jgi:hypothetical protein